MKCIHEKYAYMYLYLMQKIIQNTIKLEKISDVPKKLE